MRTATVITLVLTLTLVGACKTEKTETASSKSVTVSANLTPEQLGELGAQIKKTPDRAKDLLAQHGLTEESFEKAIRDVTENPDASRRYAAAYRRAGA